MGARPLSKAEHIERYKANALKPRGPVYLTSNQGFWERETYRAIEDFAIANHTPESERYHAWLVLARLAKRLGYGRMERARCLRYARYHRKTAKAEREYRARMAALCAMGAWK